MTVTTTTTTTTNGERTTDDKRRSSKNKKKKSNNNRIRFFMKLEIRTGHTPLKVPLVYFGPFKNASLCARGNVGVR